MQTNVLIILIHSYTPKTTAAIAIAEHWDTCAPLRLVQENHLQEDCQSLTESGDGTESSTMASILLSETRTFGHLLLQ